MKIVQLLEASNSWHPRIGWWLDNDPVTFYHGTHKSNFKNIQEFGLKSPTSGRTAGLVSLALDPNTSLGYANMYGGEVAFSAAGKNQKQTTVQERIVVVFKIPKSYFQDKIVPLGEYNSPEQVKRLPDKSIYESWVKSKQEQFKGDYPIAFDQQFYAYCEICLPDLVPARFISGVLSK